VKAALMVAPMVDVTDRHYRYFLRLLTKETVLFTEMVVANAAIHAPHKTLTHETAGQCVLQLGGSDPETLSQAIHIAEHYQYTGYNLNVGCPSPRVQSGAFGACLMAEPLLVRDCFLAMRQATDKPISIKTRLGIDAQDTYEFLSNFVKPLYEAGCQEFIIHARKAILKGLNPKQNLNIPPLDYERVYRLADDFKEARFILNGGIKNLSHAQSVIKNLHGVMLGRAVWDNPCLLLDADRDWYGLTHPVPSRAQVLTDYLRYAKRQVGVSLSVLVKPLHHLYHAQPHARSWRQYLSNINNIHEISTTYLA
jgi:tRNA-dihydrouridine synthase A